MWQSVYECRTMKETQGRSCRGLFMATASSFFFSVCSLMAKFLSKMHPTQLSLFGFAGILLAAGPVALLRREKLFPEGYAGLLLLRSLCGTLFLVTSFYAAQILPLGDASVLFYTAPVFTLVLARLLLDEPWPPHGFLVVATIAAGVLLVTQPSFLFSNSREPLADYWLGAAAAVAASLSEAVGNISLRKLKKLHFSVVLTNYGLTSLVQILLASVYLDSWTSPTDIQLPLILLLAFFTSAEQILMTVALSVEHAGPVALIQASDIVFGYVYQIMFFGESFNFLSALGAVIVASVVVYMTTAGRTRRDS